MKPHKPRIMVVEDESLVALDIKTSLEFLGYEVAAHASSGEEALQLAETSRPDLTLMDIVLQGTMDGVEAANLLWKRHKIPIVFLTAYSDADTLERAKNAGPFGYIIKPFEDKDLKAGIEIALQKYEQIKALMEDRNWLSLALKSVVDAVTAVDRDALVTFLNPVAQSLTGWDEAEALGKPLREIFQIVDGQTGDRVDIPIEKAIVEGEIVSLPEDVSLVRKTGEQVPIGDCISPMKTEDGQIVGGILIVQDNTHRRQTEEERKRYTSELEWSNKELSTFAAVVSHDLQEPLRKVIAFSDLLKDRVLLDDDMGLDYVKRVQNATQRMQQFIHSLLSYSRVASKVAKMESADLNEIVAETLSNLEIRIKETGATVTTDRLPTVEADKFQMYQLFQNLIGNALKFHRKDAPPTIRVTSRRAPAGHWEIAIADNGIGFDEDQSARIFRPFERLHPQCNFEGHGMGLAICEKIVLQHGGSIRAQSVAGQGTTFFLTFPEKQTEEKTT